MGFLKTTRSFPKIPEEDRSLPKTSEVFRRSPKSSEDVRSLPKAKLSSPSLRTRINASSLPVLFTSKIRDREEGIVIYSFYTWFSFLTWVWVHIFLEIVSSRTATTHIFSIRREKLACKREPVWDRSFQPAGVRVGRYTVTPNSDQNLIFPHDSTGFPSSMCELKHVVSYGVI